jgi:hypothetical protein
LGKAFPFQNLLETTFYRETILRKNMYHKVTKENWRKAQNATSTLTHAVPLLKASHLQIDIAHLLYRLCNNCAKGYQIQLEY